MSLELHQGIKAPEVKQRAIALLESVGLGDHADYYPHSLSGGQKLKHGRSPVL